MRYIYIWYMLESLFSFQFHRKNEIYIMNLREICVCIRIDESNKTGMICRPKVRTSVSSRKRISSSWRYVICRNCRPLDLPDYQWQSRAATKFRRKAAGNPASGIAQRKLTDFSRRFQVKLQRGWQDISQLVSKRANKQIRR